MEIEGEDGSKSQLKRGFKREFGRGLGFDSNDRTVSRRHVSFQLPNDETQTGPNSNSRVYFEVIGKNPIWVCSHGNGEIRVFRSTQRGEMEGGDLFCVSAKRPVWFSLKRIEIEGEDDNEMKKEFGNVNELAESLETSSGLKGVEDLELEDVDVSDIDPVKEFGFLVIGHEFDHYPKQMIRGPKTWDWFIEEPKEENDDDDDDDDGTLEKKRKKGTRSKRKKAHGKDDDDDWTGESEDDKELITKVRKLQKPKYTTRSKDCDKSTKIATNRGNEEDEAKDEDEDDETLGGFIVDQEDVEEEEDEDEDEEEDFEEDDDE